MEKSMYFKGKGNIFEKIAEKLQCLSVDYQIELRGDSTLSVFPHVHVRLYAELRGIFGCDCLPYKRVRRINGRRKRQ